MKSESKISREPFDGIHHQFERRFRHDFSMRSNHFPVSTVNHGESNIFPLTNVTFVSPRISALESLRSMHKNMETRRSGVEKMKNAKSADISTKSKDCQLQSMSQARENGISTPLVDNSLMRHSPQLMGEPPDGDDTDPDVIPNQYGECRLRCC